MKRMLCILLLLVTVACVPTPEVEYVVNKSDGVLEQRLYASPVPTASIPAEAATDSPHTSDTAVTPEPTAEPIVFPTHWNDTIDVTDQLQITIDAPVVTRADGVYPVYRTRARSFTPSEILAILSALMPKPVQRLSGARTKDEVAEQIKRFNEEAARWQQWRANGRPIGEQPDGEELTDEYIAEVLAEYAEQLQNAPARDTAQPVTDFDPTLDHAVYELENGKRASVLLADQWISFSIGGAENMFYTQAEYERDLTQPDNPENNAKNWQPVTISEEAATETLRAAMDRIGFDGFAIAYTQCANLIKGNGQSVASGWLFTLTRDYGGYPLEPQAKADGRIQYAEGDGYAANRPVPKETVKFLITEDGIAYFSVDGAKQVVGIVNENVALLPFDEIRERALNALRYSFSGYGGGNYTSSFTVFKAVLTVYTLRIRNEEDYYEMPCWLLLFDHTLASGDYMRDGTHIRQYRALVINAVDGSIVNPNVGY